MKKRSITSHLLPVLILLVTALTPFRGSAQLSAGSLGQTNFQVPTGQAYPINITSTAAGSGCTGTGTYTWLVGGNASTATQIPGTGNTATLSYTGTWTASTLIWRMYTCSSGGSAYTNPVAIVIQTPFTPGTVTPMTQSITTGNAPGPLSATLPTGSVFGPTYTYQWQSSPDNVNWTNVGSSSTTNSSYSPGVLTSTMYYRQAITAGPLTLWTNVATVTVNQMLPLSPGAVSPATSTAVYGTNGATLGLTGVSGGTGTGYTYQWQYSTDNVSWHTIPNALSSTYTPLNVTVKTYYQALVTNGTTLPSVSGVVYIQGEVSTVPPADNPTGSPNANINWILTTDMDASGNTISQSKGFYDNSGRQIQSQEKVFYRSNGTTVLPHVLASQPIRDAYGRDAAMTLPAPIDYADFSYRSNFLQHNASGAVYSHQNFDLYNNGSTSSDNTITPNKLWDATTGTPPKGTLAWYYSTQNNWEPYTPVTDYPYTRQTWYQDGTGAVKKSAGLGEPLIMGTGHEGSSYTTPVANELDLYLLVRNKFFPITQVGTSPLSLANNATQTIGHDANGRETVTIQDADGHTLVTARPGTDLNVNNTVTVGAAGSGLATIAYFKLLATGAVSITGGGYTLYDMNGEAALSFTSGNTLPAGFYKLVNTGTASLTLGYSNGYTDIAYSFYDQKGQLVATISPMGTRQLYGSPGLATYTSLSAVPFVKQFTYDLRGRLVSSQDPDMGTNPTNGITQLVYRNDGKMRFFQNPVQAAAGSYGYTNYDGAGRVIETGQYLPDGSGIAWGTAAMTNILENVAAGGGLTSGKKTDVSLIQYDAPDNSYYTNTSSSSLAGYVQDPADLAGKVSVTYKYSSIDNNNPVSTNLISATWFNYDEEGKITWQISYLNGLGTGLTDRASYKTTDYTYDPLNNLLKKVFQAGIAAETFVHYYDYDPANQRLWHVYTNTVDNPGSKMLQATYYYYLHGELKRVELASNLQGIDYTYTLQGALKAINNSNNGSTAQDPGGDGSSNGFSVDAFGEVLDYYTGDYVNGRTGGVAAIAGVNSSAVPAFNTGGAGDSYAGNIKAMSWFSQKTGFPGASSAPTTYVYQYDPKYQFVGGSFGTTLNFASNPATYTTTATNQETIGNAASGIQPYDGNGNILYLQRTGTYTDQFSYQYGNGNNQLTTVTNVATSTPYATYAYDANGQMTMENKTGSNPIYLAYDVTGKVTGVYQDQPHTLPIVTFAYNEAGIRVKKIDYNGSAVPIQATYYVGDVIYTQLVTNGVFGAVAAAEYQIRGTSRIGIYYPQGPVYAYELTDHLGNVRAVIAQNANTLQVRAYTDYYPFGLVLAQGNPSDRYGYQGQNAETDPETGWNAFELRMYDNRIARWMQPDPERQFYSPYIGMGNKPLNGTDPDGGFFIIDDFVYGFIGGLFQGKDQFAHPGASRFSNAVSNGERMAFNDAKIWSSFFQTDHDKTVAGQAVQILSHLTWELPQELVGTLWGGLENIIGIKSVEFQHGATIIHAPMMDPNGAGLTIGNIISVGTSNDVLKLTKYGQVPVVRHEFGHTIQSRRFGPAWLFIFGIPSLLRAAFGSFPNDDAYNKFYTEKNATDLGVKYGKNINP